MRLNYQKWRGDYDKAIGARDEAHSQAEYDLYTHQITWLLSVRAHIQGKLHRQRARLTWDQLFHWGKWSYEDAAILAGNGGSMPVDVNARDQQLWIGDSWKSYVAEDTVEKLYAEPTEPKEHKNPPAGYAPCTRADGHGGPCAHPLAESYVRRAINRALEFFGL